MSDLSASVLLPKDLRGLVAEAMEAFRSDLRFAEAMCRAATAIETKRELVTARKELKQAESEARKLCAASSPFFCENRSPCGVGDCKFAVGHLALLDVTRCGGTTPRPQQSLYDEYQIEAAIEPLRDLRRG